MDKVEELLKKWTPEQKEAFIKWATSQIKCPFCKTELGLPTEISVLDAISSHIGTTDKCKKALKEYGK
jgi:hypothetical protein